MEINKWVVCRICLRTSDVVMQKIYNNNTESDGDNSELARQIEEYGDIQLDIAEDMPDSICLKCLLLLRAAHKFRLICQRSQQQLQRLLKLPMTTKSTSEDQHESSANNVLKRRRSSSVKSKETIFVVKDEPESSMSETVEAVSDSETVGFVVDDDIVEEYIELRNDQMDFLQDDTTQNFSTDDISYVSQDQFETVKSGEDSTQTTDDANVYVYEKEEEEEQLHEGVEEGLEHEVLEDENEEIELEPPSLLRKANKIKYNSISEKAATSDFPLVKQYSVMTKSRASASDGKSSTQPTRPGRQFRTNKAVGDQDYICCHCGNMYPEKAKLTLHMKIHSKEKPHECEICLKRFAQAPQLARHMNSHTGQRPFKCKYCNSRFADPSTCIKHERIHTNERPYKCETCGKSFSYSNVLKVHVMIHTGEKPYSCEYCGKKFSQLHHKKAHVRTHNLELDIKSAYECLKNVEQIFE